MTSTSLLQLVDNLQQVGKIRNLQQVCGVSGCVSGGQIWLKKKIGSLSKGSVPVVFLSMV
jgi:hypothetical protein